MDYMDDEEEELYPNVGQPGGGCLLALIMAILFLWMAVDTVKGTMPAVHAFFSEGKR